MMSAELAVGVIGILVALGGALGAIWVALRLFHTSIDRRLQIIADGQEGILTREQAHALAEIYLDSVRFQLYVGSFPFFQNQLPDIIKKGDRAAIERFIDNTTNEHIREARNKLLPFKIGKTQSFKEFAESVNPLNGGRIRETKAKALKVLFSEEALKAPYDATKWQNSYMRFVELASTESGEDFHSKLAVLYNAPYHASVSAVVAADPPMRASAWQDPHEVAPEEATARTLS